MDNMQYGTVRIDNYIPRSSWVGTATETHSVLSNCSHRYPLTKRAGFALSGESRFPHVRSAGTFYGCNRVPAVFNLITNTCPNAMAYWSLVQQGRATAQKHVGDTLTGHRSVEAVAQGGEKPHAAPLERTDKLATGELLFNTKEKQK